MVDALEGDKPLFRCREVRRNCVLYSAAPPGWVTGGLCGIHGLMQQAEMRMREVLANCSLAELAGGVAAKMPKKHGRARRLISQLWEEGSGLLSTQVLQEFYVNVRRKAQWLSISRANTHTPCSVYAGRKTPQRGRGSPNNSPCVSIKKKRMPASRRIASMPGA